MGLEVYAAVLGTIGMIGGILAVWINLNVKVKELEVKIISIENKIDDIKQERIEVREDLRIANENIHKKLDTIEQKLDDKFELLTVLKTEHDQIRNTCVKNNNRR